MDPVLDAKFIVRDYLKKEGQEVPETEKLFLVYFSYIIGGWKCELATATQPGLMFQITHNREFSENYLDVYVKRANCVYIDDGRELTQVSSKEATSRPDVDPPICPDCGNKAVWSQGQFVCNNHPNTVRVVN